MLSNYRVAAIQFEPLLGAKAENIARLLEFVEAAARSGARLIVLPEMATTGYCWYDRAEIRPHVEPIPGPTTARFAELAGHYGCYIVVGMPEVAPRTGVFYNSAALVGPAGVVGVYRKTHSYAADMKWAKDGDLGLPVWETELGRVGIMICMDAGYCEPARLLALGGADVLCFPTNWLGEKSPAPAWMARAYENGCYLIGANRYGRERGVQFSGGSCVLDPNGTVQALQDTGDGVVYGEVSLSSSGRRAALLTARRPELYDTLTLSTYRWNPLELHGLYGHRPLPPGRRSSVAVAQIAPRPADYGGNLALVEQALADLRQRAERRGEAPPALVVFPEYALTGRPVVGLAEVTLAAAEAQAWCGRLARLAQRHETHLVVGYAQWSQGRRYSAALLVGPDGVIADYRKAHVIGAEAGWVSPGEGKPPVVDLPLGRVGLLVGSDLCFPETARTLAIEGCDLIAVPAGPGLPPILAAGPTAIPIEPPARAAHDSLHFHLARQRAYENNCYLAFASLPPPDGPGGGAIFGPDPSYRGQEEVLTSGGVTLSIVDTSNLDTPYPSSSVRAKELIRMRQPQLYDLLHGPLGSTSGQRGATHA